MDLTQPTHVVAICGGAVAGSEAARLLAEQGALVFVFEQNAHPYGKIEDGLPRWHVALRQKEYRRIDENLSAPGVLLVPNTRIGRDIRFTELTEELGFSAVILANGAWRDRPLPIADIDRFVGRGLVYQNPLVHWFNHQDEDDYAGPKLQVPDGALVVGGGLASIDVAKICQIEAYGRALRQRGVEVDALTLERRGVRALLDEHGLSAEDLGVRNATVVYRRRKQDMPLASAPNPSPERLAKLQATRARIVDKVTDKYLIELRPSCVPVAAIEERNQLAGLVLRRTETRDGRLVQIEGSEEELRSGLVIGSIGSTPEPIEGVPRRGELYGFDSEVSGVLEGVEGVYGLGNVLTGKGNIRNSRASASIISERIIENLLGVADAVETVDDLSDALHEEFRARAEPLVQLALMRPKLSPTRIHDMIERVRRRWSEVGYPGDYPSWSAENRPAA